MLFWYGAAALLILLLCVFWLPWLRSRRRPGLSWPLGFSCAALLLSVSGYQWLGGYPRLQQEAARLQDKQQQEEILLMQDDDPQLLSLQRRIRQDPERGDLWFSLGQQYLYRNQFAEALVALQQTERLQGSSAALDAAMATVLYYQAGQRMTEEVDYWLEQALVKDPLQYTALMLQASDAFTRARYDEAIAIWLRLLDSDNPDIDRAAVIRALAMARMMQ